MEYKKKFKTFFVSLLFLVVLFSPLAGIEAQQCPDNQQPTEGIAGIDFHVFRRAVVPCGRQCDDPRTTQYDETGSCTLCHLMILVKNIFDLLFAWLIIVALIFLTVSGVMFILSSGNSSLKSLAKSILTKTLTGFSIFVLSWLIVRTVLIFISADISRDSPLGFGGSDVWYGFTCGTESRFDGPLP